MIWCVEDDASIRDIEVYALRSTGFDELWYTKGSIDPYGDKAIRSGLGVQFALKLRCFENLETLHAAAARFGYDKVCLLYTSPSPRDS